MSQDQLTAIDFLLKVLIGVVSTIIAGAGFYLGDAVNDHSTQIARLETRLDDWVKHLDGELEEQVHAAATLQDVLEGILNQLRDHERRLLIMETERRR